MASRKVVYQSFERSDETKMKAFTARVPAELIERLDEQADLRGQSRAFIVHQALEMYAWMLKGGYTVAKFEIFEQGASGASSVAPGRDET